jgi:hypothetical protein
MEHIKFRIKIFCTRQGGGVGVGVVVSETESEGIVSGIGVAKHVPTPTSV